MLAFARTYFERNSVCNTSGNGSVWGVSGVMGAEILSVEASVGLVDNGSITEVSATGSGVVVTGSRGDVGLFIHGCILSK